MRPTTRPGTRLGAPFLVVALIAGCGSDPSALLAAPHELETVTQALDHEHLPMASSNDVVAALEANVEAQRRGMRTDTASAFDRLRARLPGDLIAYSSSVGPSPLLATAEGDLLPDRCRVHAGGANPDFEAAIRCFLEMESTLMLHTHDADRGTAPELVFTENARGFHPGPPEQYLRTEQVHRGYRVDERSMAFVFSDHRLVSATGRFAGTSAFQVPAVDESFLEAEVHRQFGEEARVVEFIYNPDSGELELRVFVGDDEHRLNAADGTRRSSRSRVHSLEVTKGVAVYQFPSSVYLGVGQSYSVVSSPVTCQGVGGGVCDVPGSGSCNYFPRQAVANADRAIGVETVSAGGTVTQCVEQDPCGSTSVFNQWPWTSQYDLRHYAASARRVLDEAADVLQHSESFFWAYPRTPLDYRLRVSAQPSDAAGSYSPASPRTLTLYQDPDFYGRENARDLSTVAHEFGHYVHHTISGLYGQGHVKEAWAAKYALRMATHRRFVTGQWPSLAYQTDLLVGGWTWQLQNVVRKGEYILDLYPNPTNCPAYPGPPVGNTCPDWVYYKNTSNFCPHDIYSCGGPMWTTYWVLAHDRCRISFMDCSSNQDIIQYAGGYQNSAWRLANSTYAYAIKNVSANANLGEFMYLVAARYAYFRAQGYLSTADENRVLSVLAAQCLGPASACGWHRLPGSPLPSAFTAKHPLFREAESGVLSNGATIVSASNLSSGDQHVLFGSSGLLRLGVYITVAGTYRVHFALKPTGTATDEIRLYDPGTSTWKNVGRLSSPQYQNEWDWRTETDGDADVTFSTSGSKDIWLSADAAHITNFVLDAIGLEKI